MKNLLQLLAVLTLFTSCRSVTKMIDSGNYEEAINTAHKRMKGDKRKSTKNVQYLEEAYAKLLHRDVDKINYLTNENKPENLDKIYDIYVDIKRKQDLIQPLLPLVSKSGYHASFKFLNTEPLMKSIAKEAATYHYEEGLLHLATAEKGHKYSARKAYEEFVDVKFYFKHFKDTDALMNKAVSLGKTRVLVDTRNSARVAMPLDFEKELLSINIKSLNDVWTEYFYVKPENFPIDILAEVQINAFDVSPERELVREYMESKEVEDGYEYFYDSNGNVAKDTLGNDIKKVKYTTIFATITEVKKEKAALVGGSIEFKSKNSGETLRTRSFAVESIFDDVTYGYRGDRNAISSKYRNNLNRNPLPFPSDEILALDAAGKLKLILMDEMKSFEI